MLLQVLLQLYFPFSRKQSHPELTDNSKIFVTDASHLMTNAGLATLEEAKMGACFVFLLN